MAEKIAHLNKLGYWQLRKLGQYSKRLNTSEFIFHRKSVGNRKILLEASKYIFTIFFCVRRCQSDVWEISAFHSCDAKPQTGALPLADPGIIVLDLQQAVVLLWISPKPSSLPLTLTVKSCQTHKCLSCSFLSLRAKLLADILIDFIRKCLLSTFLTAVPVPDQLAELTVGVSLRAAQTEVHSR